MLCPNCKFELVESNMPIDEVAGLFYQEFYCFKCTSLYECTSLSGDFVEEYLNEVGV
mgnify:CR=1 FL=1